MIRCQACGPQPGVPRHGCRRCLKRGREAREDADGTAACESSEAHDEAAGRFRGTTSPSAGSAISVPVLALGSALALPLDQEALRQKAEELSMQAEVRFMQVRRFLRRVNRADLRVVMMLDEFESLATNAAFDASFYGELRSLAGELGVPVMAQIPPVGV